MSKKVLVVLTLLVIGSLFLAACGPAAEEPVVEPTEEVVVEEPTEEEVVEEPTEEEVVEEPTEEEVVEEPAEEPFKVGLVTDVGEIDDKSFNQAAWEGVVEGAEALGAEYNYIETSDAKDYMANIQLFADDGYDVIVTVGFAITDATLEAAAMYPEINFIGVDQGQWAGTVDNVAGLIFNEDK
ncbi:MAG: BMP family ABC transporter substrate-binding protein, partial [Anaerolineae bacterium]|nr:BMP family ABC transporter substrate-binding protein [Anaerolineae bacterium]